MKGCRRAYTADGGGAGRGSPPGTIRGMRPGRGRSSRLTSQSPGPGLSRRRVASI